jgi:hypothetical protein
MTAVGYGRVAYSPQCCLPVCVTYRLQYCQRGLCASLPSLEAKEGVRAVCQESVVVMCALLKVVKLVKRFPQLQAICGIQDLNQYTPGNQAATTMIAAPFDKCQHSINVTYMPSSVCTPRARQCKPRNWLPMLGTSRDDVRRPC